MQPTFPIRPAHAVRYAFSIGNGSGASVTLLHVIPDVLDALSRDAGIDLADHIGKKARADFHINGIEKDKETRYQRIRETSRLVSQEIPCCPLTEDDVVVKIGNPVKQIVATAQEGDFDLIIMGNHGHGKMEERQVVMIGGGPAGRTIVHMLHGSGQNMSVTLPAFPKVYHRRSRTWSKKYIPAQSSPNKRYLTLTLRLSN
ncbi:MAG: universal stress protein [Desulfosarcina sp.]|nr:universal stress protein [Desulfosarcina sp.]